MTVKVAPRALLISLFLWESAGVTETVMLFASFVFNSYRSIYLWRK